LRGRGAEGQRGEGPRAEGEKWGRRERVKIIIFTNIPIVSKPILNTNMFCVSGNKIWHKEREGI
jgi:hypothetical protein